MVSPILKVLGEEVAVGTGGENFNGATLIRVYNNKGSEKLVEIKNAAGGTTGSFTLRNTETVFVRKLPAENIFAGDDLRMVPIAF